jgi:riboflavin kinase/FMN adenylyltransferase
VNKGLIFGLENIDYRGFVLTQGTFDGVHSGHQQILKQVVSQAKKLGLPSMLLTFHPHPRTVVQPSDWKPRILHSIYEKSERVLSLGIDVVLVLPFTESISQLSPESFV